MSYRTPSRGFPTPPASLAGIGMFLTATLGPVALFAIVMRLWA